MLLPCIQSELYFFEIKKIIDAVYYLHIKHVNRKIIFNRRKNVN